MLYYLGYIDDIKMGVLGDFIKFLGEYGLLDTEKITPNGLDFIPVRVALRLYGSLTVCSHRQ